MNKRYELDPLESEVVRAIFKSYVEENRSQLQIAADLNLREVPSAKRTAWTPTTVGQILMRRGYTGDVEWGGETTKGARPPIIDVATYEAARARAAVKRTLPAGRTQTSPYLLSGLVWCARCGGRMIGHSANGGDPAHRGYVCSNHRKHGKCSLNWHRGDVLEGAVLDAIDRILGDTTEAAERAQDEATRLQALLVGVETALSGIPARFERNLDRYERGVFGSEEQFRLANHALVEEQGRLERERDRLRDDIERARLAVSHVETLSSVRPASEQFASMPLQERKSWMQQVIERIDCDARKEPVVRLRY